MKKTTILFACLFLAISGVFSQRISNLTVKGQTSLTPFGAFNPKNNGKRTGTGEIIYPSTVDLSNVNVTIDAGEEATVSPDPLPTDWTNTVSGIKISSTVNSDWADYNITIKKVNPSPLPLVINTGTDGDFNSGSWTSETIGWAGAAIDKGKNVIRFGSAKRSFVVAFNEAPETVKYTIKALGDWTLATTNVFDVDASSDGITWHSVHQYNATNPMPPSSPAVEVEFDLKETDRYVRWIYTERNKPNGAFNVLLEDITVSKRALSSVEEILATINVSFDSESNMLYLKESRNIENLTLYSLSGISVYGNFTPTSSMKLPELERGVYILKMNLKDGNTVSTKVIKH